MKVESESEVAHVLNTLMSRGTAKVKINFLKEAYSIQILKFLLIKKSMDGTSLWSSG